MVQPMNIRPLARRALKLSAAVLAAALTLGASAAAAAPNPIEAVWSFNGGAVAVQALSDGTFQGTVVTPTKFASCEHPAGQVMWTDMQLQTDGSFWGLHQWYHAAPQCEENTVLGHTAWRVLEASGGAHVLKVCFNNPGDASQPTIAPNGKEANVTYGCVESSPLAPLPKVSEEEGPGKGGGEGSGNGSGANGSSGGGADSGVITFSQAVVLPNAKACVSQASLKIKLRDPKYDPLTEVLVKINGKKVALVKGVKRLKKGITLKKLPSGTYKVSVVATTVLKQHLSGSQTYKSCSSGSGKIGLKRIKKHHHHHA